MDKSISNRQRELLVLIVDGGTMAGVLAGWLFRLFGLKVSSTMSTIGISATLSTIAALFVVSVWRHQRGERLRIRLTWHSDVHHDGIAPMTYYVGQIVGSLFGALVSIRFGFLAGVGFAILGVLNLTTAMILLQRFVERPRQRRA